MSPLIRFIYRSFAVTPVIFALALASVVHAQQNSGAHAASGTTPAAGEVTVMDTLVVTEKQELPPPEVWYQTKIPGFDVLSNARERTTKKLLQDFEMFRTALEIACSVNVNLQRPATLIFCARDSFEQFIPRADRADMVSEMGRASITLIGREHDFIVLDLGTSTLSLNDSTIDLDLGFGASAMFDVDYYRVLYREYVHYLLSQGSSSPPVWYEEGMLQIIQKMEIDPKRITIGEIQSRGRRSTGQQNAGMAPTATSLGSSGEETEETSPDADLPGMEIIEDGDFNTVLDRRALLGFKEFFGVTRDSPQARNPLGNNVWAKQCYAFVHMCNYALPNKYKGALEKLVARARTGPVTEEMFAECFGKPYKKVLVELRGYIGFTAYEKQQFNATGKHRIDAPLRELTPVPEGESSRIKTDALLLANNAGAGLPSMRAAYARGERNPEFLATYGLACAAAGQTEMGRRMLSQAIAATTTRAAAHAAYAGILLDDAILAAGGPERAKLEPAQLATVLQPLFTARKMKPPLPQTYQTIAKAWRYSAAVPKTENFGVVREGLALFPRDVKLVYESTQVLLRMGNAEAARALATHGLRVAADDEWREKFTQLLQLPQLAKGAPAPEVPAKTPQG